MIKAVVAGVSVCLILQVLIMNAAGYVYECCVSPQSAPRLWYAMLSAPLGALAGLLLGFIAGGTAQLLRSDMRLQPIARAG